MGLDQTMTPTTQIKTKTRTKTIARQRQHNKNINKPLYPFLPLLSQDVFLLPPQQDTAFRTAKTTPYSGRLARISHRKAGLSPSRMHACIDTELDNTGPLFLEGCIVRVGARVKPSSCAYKRASTYNDIININTIINLKSAETLRRMGLLSPGHAYVAVSLRGSSGFSHGRCNLHHPPTR